MKKLIKFKNDYYLDTSAIYHKEQLLSEFLENNNCWSGPINFTIESDDFDLEFPERNYYVRNGNVIMIAMCFRVKKDIVKGRHNITATIPTAKFYTPVVGLIQGTKFLVGDVFLAPTATYNIRIYPGDSCTVGDMIAAQAFYIANN